MEPTNTNPQPAPQAPVQPPVAPAPIISSDLDLNLEIEALKKKIEASTNMPQGLKDKANGMINRLVKMAQSGTYSQEFEPVSEYINWVTQLPFGKYEQENLDLVNAKSNLDKYNYGLETVKNRVMEYLAVIKLQNLQLKVVQGDVANLESDMAKLEGNSSHSPILCFVGIQGVGKTSMAKAMSIALNRKFMRISLGGLSSVTEIRGIVRGQLNAEPGQIIKALVRTQSMNPLVLLDEIEKVSTSGGTKADVMAALLEILDPEQNSTFMDKYLDYPIDLSKVMFICTANNLGGISAALLDRLEIIRFGSYTDNDKIMIAKNYLLPKVREATGITEAQLSFEDDAWPLIIRPLGFDAGVRQLERTLTELARKVALQIVQGLATGVRITAANFRQYIPEDMGVFS
ncbi:MAG: AAA family ATPase [Candidatus Dojkabacteria bacterium]